tara:strand:- start:371 stop:604 length:234 start_codon:yes stop_codon:yes gene_type:complete
MMKKEVVLEPSTNTHKISADGVEVKDLGNGILHLTVNGDGVVTHGEHGTLKTESKNVIKYVQQELNPVTRKIQNAVD